MRSTLLVVLPALVLLAGCPSEVKAPPPPPPAPEIVSFFASDTSVSVGEKVTLHWLTRNATDIEIRDPAKGLVSGVDPSAAAGELEVTVNGDQMYVLTAKNERGVRASSAVVITVEGSKGKVIFLASPPQLRAGESAVLAWSAPGAKAVSLAVADGDEIDLGGQLTSGSVKVRPATTTAYVLTVDGKTFTAEVEVGPSIDVLVGAPNPVQPGETLTVSWKTTGATSVTLNGAVEGQLHEETEAAKVADGSFDVEVPASADRGAVLSYELVASAADGTSASQKLQIYVGGTVGVTSFTAPAQVPAGGSFPVSWTTAGADRVEIFAGATRVYVSPSAAVAASGNAQLDAPSSVTDYTLHAFDARGTEAVSDPVTVEPLTPPEVVVFTATPSTITYAGQPVTLNWNATDAQKVRVIELGSTTAVYETTGAASQTGPVVVYPAHDTQYRVVVDNGIGVRDFASVDVTVTHPAAFTFSPAIVPLNSPITVIGHNVVTAVGVDIPPAFIDISTTGVNTNYSGADTTPHAVTMPQSFSTTLFGQAVSGNKITVSINGWFVIGSSSSYEDGPITLPTTDLAPFAIIPLFDDFYYVTNSEIYYQLDQVGSDQRLIVQWNNVEWDPNSGSALTFQAQVYSSGRIVFAYGPFSGYNGTTAVRGVLNDDETQAEVVPGIPGPNSSVSVFGSNSSLPTTIFASATPLDGKVLLASGGVVKIHQQIPYERVSISEINAHPPSTVTDGQWFEIENRSLQPLDISGMTLDFGGGSTHTVAANTIIPPMSFFVLGQSATAGDGLAVDYVYGNAFTIPASGGVALVDGSTTVASFTLPALSLPEGASWQTGVVPQSLTTIGGVNELGCTAASASTYGTNDQRGTPGAQNTLCPNYAMTGSINGNFEAIASTGTKLSFDNLDDDIATITLPSPVLLDGVPFGQLVVSTNGYLSLDPAYTCDTYCYSTPKTSLDPSEAPVGLIAPFWADLDTTTHGGVYWERKEPGVTPNDGYTIVSWENVHRFDEAGDNLNFQAKFFDNGNVEFHYGAFIGEDGTDATTWVERPSGDAAFIFNVDSADSPGIAPNSAFRLTAK